MRSITLLLTVLVLTTLAVAVPAEKVYKEDLSVCKLPCGEALMPDRNTREAKKGYILRFSDQTLNPSPFKGDPPSAREFLKRTREEKSGDLIYSRLEGGCFVAISGRIADLGKGFLHEFSGRRLTRPKPVMSIKERSKGEGTPGAMEELQQGHCYLAETVEGKLALVRLVQKRGDFALVQYVYQPDGSATFDIPKGKLTEVAWRPPRPPAPPLPPAKVAGKVTDVPTLLAIRKKMIAELIGIVKKPAATPQEKEAKGNAIRALAQLRAREAVPVLIDEIEFRHPYGMVMDAITTDQFFCCVPALQAIGKPGSLAALAAIEKVQLTGPDEEKTKAKLRLRLLVRVVSRVEGRDVAEFMIQARMDKAPAEARPALELALEKLRD